MAKTAQGFGTQFAALPFRAGPDGLRVLLLTSRETRRWIIPKGWQIHGLKPRDVAAREAFEEGGLVASIVGKHAIGSCHYSKQLPDQREILSYVRVFLLRVDQQLDVWPEKEPREWHWVDPTKAAQMVDEGRPGGNHPLGLPGHRAAGIKEKGYACVSSAFRISCGKAESLEDSI
jgi:8-oxo-dGTP pyrophosphatase MutT (NUDIX family)